MMNKDSELIWETYLSTEDIDLPPMDPDIKLGDRGKPPIIQRIKPFDPENMFHMFLLDHGIHNVYEKKDHQDAAIRLAFNVIEDAFWLNLHKPDKHGNESYEVPKGFYEKYGKFLRKLKGRIPGHGPV